MAIDAYMVISGEGKIKTEGGGSRTMLSAVRGESQDERQVNKYAFEISSFDWGVKNSEDGSDHKKKKKKQKAKEKGEAYEEKPKGISINDVEVKKLVDK